LDLDDAVIRRLPRRIYVDLLDADNRSKILKIFLAKENVEPSFDVQSLANATEGYSESDLKNLCIAAAYRPVQELLDEEKKGKSCDTTPTLRPLSLDDFIQSKAKVGPSVAYDAASMNELRKWNDQYGEGNKVLREYSGIYDYNSMNIKTNGVNGFKDVGFRYIVDLPDADNRSKILKIFLAKENVEPGFDVQSLAVATEGYSGSDLKNLCIVAAYRPVEELLDEEKKVSILQPFYLVKFGHTG
ncbi:uncharacterized AAA domain-containing protein-like protein isoform X1, partial [Tanacetum coccineum]